MIPLLGGTTANLTVDPAVAAAVEGKVRAIKVVVDAKAEKLVCARTLPEGPNLEEDFLQVGKEVVEDALPCLVLIRLESDSDWALVGWTPDDAPVKQRMLCASSKKTLREHFSKLNIKEYNATEKEEVTLAQFKEATGPTTQEQRHAAMTQAEIDRESVNREVAKEQMAGPMRLAGMGTVSVKVQDSFADALKAILDEEGKAVLGRFTGDKSEELGGDILEGVSTPSQFKGKFPEREPCYAVVRATPVGDNKRLLLLSWLPEDAPIKMKMRCSTFKASVLAAIKERAGPEVSVIQSEVNDNGDLLDSLASPAAVAEQPLKQEAAAAPSGVKKPPPGAVAMPGMMAMPPGGLAGGLAALKKVPPKT